MLKRDVCEHAWTVGLAPVLFCFSVRKSRQLTAALRVLDTRPHAFIRNHPGEFTCSSSRSVERDGGRGTGTGTAGVAPWALPRLVVLR